MVQGQQAQSQQAQSKRVRAPEVPLTRFLILLFTLLVAAALYYEFGGPVPYYIHFDGPSGATFQGRYAAVDDAAAGLPKDAETLRGTYPQTVTLWGPRWQGVVATSQTGSDQNALHTIRIRRAWVTCSEAYRWGTDMSVVCGAQ